MGGLFSSLKSASPPKKVDNSHLITDADRAILVSMKARTRVCVFCVLVCMWHGDEA